MNPAATIQQTTRIDSGADLFTQAENLRFGDLHFKVDEASGLRAVIAIHSARLGPALGGCRCIPYHSTSDAATDAMNLAHAMSYKAAMAGLPLGGGKAVIMQPERIENRTALFEAYGRFVDELGGRYISSVDSGTSPADMDAAARFTKHVRSTSQQGLGDPSPTTAFGVRRGIEAAVKHRLGRDSLEGIRVSIQGVGHVGYPLAQQLHLHGARLTVCDINPANTARCRDELSAEVVSVDQIFDSDCDVFAPCALGGVINDKTIEQLKATIVAGATNNPLQSDQHAEQLHRKNILYAPDYVINAGGLMQVWLSGGEPLELKVNGIHDTLLEIFNQAEQRSESPAIIANRMAEEILYGAPV